MNREIKFRAWDKTLNCMITVRNINDLTDSNLDIMQYIGLKDEKGKEVFEGDVIRENKYFNCTYEIAWDEDNCWFIGIKINDRDYNSLEFPQLAECGEVIGNIYENPELLER